MLSLAATILCAMAIFSLSKYIALNTGDSRERAEHKHGIKLPPSASTNESFSIGIRSFSRICNVGPFRGV